MAGEDDSVKRLVKVAEDLAYFMKVLAIGVRCQGLGLGVRGG